MREHLLLHLLRCLCCFGEAAALISQVFLQNRTNAALLTVNNQTFLVVVYMFVISLVCRHMTFFAGSILAVLIILTVIDEDVLSVEHVLALMTILGLVMTVCRVLIPNEVSCCSFFIHILTACVTSHVFWVTVNTCHESRVAKLKDKVAVFCYINNPLLVSLHLESNSFKSSSDVITDF